MSLHAASWFPDLAAWRPDDFGAAASVGTLLVVCAASRSACRAALVTPAAQSDAVGVGRGRRNDVSIGHGADHTRLCTLRQQSN